MRNLHMCIEAALAREPCARGNTPQWKSILTWLLRVGVVVLSSYGENLLNASATAELAEWLGGSLPVGTTPTQAYTGPPKLVARAVCSSVDDAEFVPVSVVVLASEPPSSIKLMHRQMGVGEWQATVMQRTGGVGSVYNAEFAVNQHGDGEYFILAHVDGVELRWPECVEAARQTCATQTVIVVADASHV